MQQNDSNRSGIGFRRTSIAKKGRRARRAQAILAGLIAIIFMSGPITAQISTDETTRQQIESISGAVSMIDRLSQNEAVADQTLSSARVKLEGLGSDLRAIDAAVAARLADVNARIDQLPQPVNGTSEPNLVAEKRAALGEEKAGLVILSGRISETMSMIATTTEQIAKRRRAAFSAALLLRTPVGSTLLEEATKTARREVAGLRSLAAGWFRFVLDTKATALVVSTTAAVAFALILLFATRRIFSSVLYRDPEIEKPSYFSKILIGFCSATLPSLVFALFLAITYGFYTYLGIFNTKISLITQSLLYVLAGIVFGFYLARAILAPGLPHWRLIAVHDAAAARLCALAVAMATIYGLDAWIDDLIEIVAAPLALTIIKSFLTSLAIGFVIIAIALTRGRAKLSDDGQIIAAPWPRWFSLPILFIGFVVIVSALLGYVGLARFAAQQIVVTGAILITIYIGILAGRQIGAEGLLANSSVGRWLQDRLSLQPEAIEQIGIITSVLFIGLVILTGIPLILLQWGSQPDDILLWAGKIFSGVQIGAVKISLSGLLLGIIVFAAVLIITRFLQKWISTNVLARSKVDSGVRDSIRTGIGYSGFALATLLAVTSAGVDLSSLAIVAGALSIGIGFGLQNVVSNFVSGLILLVERPIKVGDWVEAGGTSGFVKKISVRATEIETFQKQSMILPNSELINSVVGNWTHKYRGGRVEIPIGVAYGSNVREVEKILYRLASEHPSILKHPEPFVLFKGFGDSSLDFELRFHLADITQILRVSTDVRFALVEAFENAGIVIPFPQRDVHIKHADIDVPNLETATADEDSHFANEANVQALGKSEL